MSQKLIDLYMLLVQKDIQAHTHGPKAGIEIISHKISQSKFALRGTHEQRASFFKTGHMLTGEITVGKKTATVRIALQCFIIKGSEQLVHIHVHAHCLCKFLKYIHPRIQIRGAVVGMCHGNRISGRRCDHIDLFIWF